MIRDSKAFVKGAILAVTFWCVMLAIFSPIFGTDANGKGLNGLQYSDNFFNTLAKGSSYFIPGLKADKIPAVSAEPVKLSYKLKDIKGEDPAKDAALMDKAVKLAVAAGSQATVVEDRIEMTANVRALLEKAAADSEDMYNNDALSFTGRYGVAETEAKPLMKAWWNLLSGMVKELQKQDKNADAEAVNQVIKKAVEPAYNFYGIKGEKVSERAVTLIGLLVFYVVYTMWWGFAIFYMFEGFGLSTKKAKVKKEV